MYSRYRQHTHLDILWVFSLCNTNHPQEPSIVHSSLPEHLNCMAACLRNFRYDNPNRHPLCNFSRCKSLAWIKQTLGDGTIHLVCQRARYIVVLPVHIPLPIFFWWYIVCFCGKIYSSHSCTVFSSRDGRVMAIVAISITYSQA